MEPFAAGRVGLSGKKSLTRAEQAGGSRTSTYFKIRVPHFPVSPHSLFHHSSSVPHISRETSHSLEHAEFWDNVVGEEGRKPGGAVGTETSRSHRLRRFVPLSAHAPGIGRGHGSIIASVSTPILTPLTKVIPGSVLVLIPTVPVEVVVVTFVGVIVVVFGLVVIVAGSVHVAVVDRRPRVVGFVRVIPARDGSARRH